MKAIMYHYVRPDSPDLPYFRHLHVEDFDRQLDYFQDHLGFVSKGEFLAALASGRPSQGAILTFDDGFDDHVRHVLPRLLERGLWGIFYIPTGVYPAGKLLDVHRIHLLLGKHGGQAVFEALMATVSDSQLSHAHVHEFRTQTYKRQKNDDYVNAVKRTLNYYISYEYRQSAIDRLMAGFGLDETAEARAFYMSEPALRSLHEAGMIVGSHTVSHPVMSKLGRAQQEAEIRGSFEYLEGVTGGLKVRTFCYPYGGYHTFTAETEALLDEHGCRFAFNVEPRDIDGEFLAGRRQALPRYDCNAFPFGACRVQDL
jgi:peptidoglycan/xylan/chitin deacetylase (PgdA/CDA1 family)